MDVMEKKVSLGKLFLWIWAVGATLFIVWQLLQQGAYNMGIAAGQNAALGSLAQRAQDPATCRSGIALDQAGKLVLIPVSCLQQPETDAKKK